MARCDGAAEPLWRFSLMVYARPGVAPALIGLQDRAGHNVNLILYGLWLALCRGMRLDAAALGRARAAIERLDREIVAPLRRLRRALKDDPDPDIGDLRHRVLALEIAAERRVLARLAACPLRRRPDTGDRGAVAAANLRLILGAADFASAEGVLLRRAIAP